MLDRPAEIHHDHLVGEVPDHREIVRDEQIGEVELLLQLDQEIEDLGLDRDVERRDRLVEHDDPRPQHQRAGDRDALALAAREHVRVARVVLGAQAHPRQHVLDCGRAPRLTVIIMVAISSTPPWTEG